MIDPPLAPEHREISRGVFRELLRQRPVGAAEPRPDSDAVVERALAAFESDDSTPLAGNGSLAIRMQTLLVQALGRVRLEQPKPRRRTLRVADLLRQLQACTLTERGIWITLEVDQALHVEADDVLLSCALGHLLHNAVRFSRSRGRVGLRCYGEPGGVVIEVEDECGGFPASAKSPAAPRHSGTLPADIGDGLGLTRDLVLAMDGLLEVSGRREVGCAFALSLPAARALAAAYPPRCLEGGDR